MYSYKVNVTRIVDGDTVDVDVDLGFAVWLKKQRVRMHGSDTPESRTRDLTEKWYGKLSKKWLEDTLANQEVTLKSLGKGKFGRILGILEINGQSINDKMIEENMAVPYEGQSKSDIEQAHLQNRVLLESKGIKHP